MEKYGADGDVIEINLSTVKIRELDKTITTIPTQNLISIPLHHSTAESAGRRIKRSILISTPRPLLKAVNWKIYQIERISSHLQNEFEIDQDNQASKSISHLSLMVEI